MLENIKAVLFDLDGTLVDSMWVWNDIDIEYLARFGLSLPDDLQKAIEGMSFTETAIYVKERFSLPDSIEKMKEDWNAMAFDKYVNEVPLKRGVPEFLSICSQKGIKLGIATSNSRQLVDAIIASHGLTRHFDGIVTGCEVNRGKPWPDVYLETARKCGIFPEHCLVFEDIIPGIQAGKNAGMKVCAVADVYSACQEQEKRKLADYYIEDFTEITE